jgi:AcrR family transcriptional regulator
MAKGASRAARVSPGGHELSREFIAQHQRRRITKAMAEVVARKGYRATTVADIVKEARIARNTFYDNFSSKEECFLAAFDAAVKEAGARVATAYEEADSDFPARVRAGLGAFLGYVADEPALARSCIVEALSVGREGMDRYEDSIRRFVPLLRGGRELSPNGVKLPETIEETILGGIAWILYQRLSGGETDKVEALLPELVEFALTPYLGPAEARKAAQAEAQAEA